MPETLPFPYPQKTNFPAPYPRALPLPGLSTNHATNLKQGKPSLWSTHQEETMIKLVYGLCRQQSLATLAISSLPKAPRLRHALCTRSQLQGWHGPLSTEKGPGAAVKVRQQHATPAKRLAVIPGAGNNRPGSQGGITPGGQPNWLQGLNQTLLNVLR